MHQIGCPLDHNEVENKTTYKIFPIIIYIHTS